MFEDTRVELWHDEAVTLADVLARLRDWLVPGSPACVLLAEHLARAPGIFPARRLSGVLECLELYGARIAERIASAEAHAAI